MNDIVSFNQFILNERLGVPENILLEGENLYYFILDKLKSIKDNVVSNKKIDYDSKITISDLVVDKCIIDIDFIKIKEPKLLLKGMYFGSNYSVKNYKLVYKGNDLKIGLDFWSGDDIKFSDVIDNLNNEKDYMISSFSHELKHLYDRYKIGKFCVDLSTTYDTFSNTKFRLHQINTFIYLLYYFNKTENLVRSTEIASLISSMKITKKEFLNFLKETEFYKMCKRASLVSLENIKNDIWNGKDFLIKEFERSGIHDYPSDKEGFIDFSLEVIRSTVGNKKFKLLKDVLTTMIKSQNPMILLLTNYKEEVQNWAISRAVRFTKGSSDEFFEGLIKDLKRDSSIILKKISKLYDLCLDSDKKVNESLPSQRSVNQLKKLRKLTKGVDIGDRTPNMKKQGANIHFMHNPIDDDHIESYEDFEKKKKSFKPGWNARGEVSPNL